MAYVITQVSTIQAKSRQCVVEFIRPFVYDVTSPSGKVYRVEVAAEGSPFLHTACSCQRQDYIGWRNGHENRCSHVQAALNAHWVTNHNTQIVFRDSFTITKQNRKLHRRLKGLPVVADGVACTGRPATNRSRQRVGGVVWPAVNSGQMVVAAQTVDDINHDLFG